MKSTILRHVLALSALASLPSCGESLDPGSRVVSLRVLAQSMDAPYAAPGETVHVSSLATDPQGRPLHWAWAACLNPATSEVNGCVDAIGLQGAAGGTSPLIAEGVGVDSVDVTIPSDALSSLPEPARAGASLGVLSIACPGSLSFDPSNAGLPFHCRELDTGRELELPEFVIGVKRVVIRERDRNQNPSFARISFDGEEWPEDRVVEVAPCEETGNDFAACAEALQHEIVATPTPESFETGTTEFGESFSEQIVVQYFATEGNFEYDTRIGASPTTQWAPRKQATGQELTFWFVIRDNRGGVSWVTRRARVQ